MQERVGAITHVGIQRLQTLSIATKALCVMLVGFYLLSFIPGVHDNLAVTPAYIAPPHVKLWTLLTASFYENHFYILLLDFGVLIAFSNTLDSLWTVKEFWIFTCVVGVTSLSSGVVVCVILYAILHPFSLLFVSFHGFVGLLCGYIVAIKQFHPDSVAFPPPAPPSLRVKHLPIVILLLSLCLAVIGLLSFATCWLVATGVLSSWIYLRFYQKKGELRGDMSESFSFANFFPEAIQPPIATLGDAIFRVLVMIKVCPKAVRMYDVSSASSTIKISLPGSDPVDAQRRKQRALKALDERLSKVEHPPQQSSWPSLDDEGSQEEDTTTGTTALFSTPTGTPLPPPGPVAIEMEASSGEKAAQDKKTAVVPLTAAVTKADS